MKQVPEKATVTQLLKTRWLAKTRAYLEIRNPAIVKVFVISSLATFTSGIGLAFEWSIHGKSHIGFEWIIYYALFLICVPLLIWIGLILMAISCTSSGTSQIADKEVCTKQTEKAESLAISVDSDERKNKKMKMAPPRMIRAVSFPSHGKVRSFRTR